MLPIVFLAALAAGAQPAAEADLLVVNARIYATARAKPVSAMAVKDGRVVALGDAALRHAGPSTKRLDLAGAAVFPSFIDSHAHMRGLGALLESRDLRNVKSVAEIAAYVKERAAAAPKGEWIVARNWDQTNWGGAFPSAKDLDSAAPDHPVFLSRVDGHAAWVNSLALKLAGIDDWTPDPPGGKIIRDAQGRATGVLIDRAMGLVRDKMPPPSHAQIKRQLELAARECARLGLAGVHDAGVSAEDLRAYRELLAEGRLPIRIYAMIGGAGPLWREYLRKGPEIGPFLTVRAIKLYADGALGSRGAALWQPYSDDKQNTGLLITPKEEIEKVAREAVQHGFQVCTHAIGDRANRIVLDAYAAALGGANDRRFRIEHAQVVSLPDFRLFREYSVIPAIQAAHATSDMRWAEARLGPDRVAGAYAWKRFLALGIPVPNGSDFPVEEPNPFFGFHASITRQDREGNPPGGWMPDQKMSREEALESWTIHAAYAAFEEKVRGTLEPGKYADFIVLDRDLLTIPPKEILQARVRMHYIGGRLASGGQ
ncbi:MAG: amidohydrolase [Bryobacteraceae bacterium]|nr:MAG: amidohydrolase [Bryobacteraceae bacterium]